jgi:hypothetical protein
LFADLVEIHVGLARLGKHSARLLFFLHMMLDHFREHLDLGVEVVVVRRRRLDLGDQFLRAFVLDLGLVMRVLVVGRVEKRRIENLFLDGGVDGERVADAGGQVLLALVIARLLELLEPLFDLAVIRLEQCNRVLRRRRLSPTRRLRSSFCFRLAMLRTPCWWAAT